jgi:hypothetical protein
MSAPARSRPGRFLRVYLWALLAALLLGFGLGLWIRHRLDAPRVQMGRLQGPINAVAAPIPAP